MKLFLMLLASLLIAACSQQGIYITPQSIAPAPPVKVIRSLESKQIVEIKGQPYFQFQWKDRTFRVAHGKWKIAEAHADWNKMYGWGPVVWVTEGKNTRVLDLRKDFPTNYVAHVFQDEEGGRIFLFFDYGIEGPAREYHVWITEDRGEHWFAGADLKRPPDSFPPASLENFYLDRNGEGTAWFHLESTSLPLEKRGSLSPQAEVYYRARTNDGGHTWEYEKEPIFSTVIRQEVERHH